MFGWRAYGDHRWIRLCVKWALQSFVSGSCVMWLRRSVRHRHQQRRWLIVRLLCQHRWNMPRSRSLLLLFDTHASLVIDDGERKWRTLPLLNIIEVCKIAYCRTNNLPALGAPHGTKSRHPHKCLRSASDECSSGTTGDWSSVVTGDTVGSLAHDSLRVAVQWLVQRVGSPCQSNV